MDTNQFIELAKSKVVYYNHATIGKDTVSIDNVLLVWYSKSLRNHKALLITNDMDGHYYEVTYNGQTDQLYVDVYKKDCNICFENASDIKLEKNEDDRLTALKETMFDELYNSLGSNIDDYVDEDSYVEFLQLTGKLE